MLPGTVPPPATDAAGQPRHILLITHGYPPWQANGAELQAHRKARWWQTHGCEVRVLAADPRPATVIPFGQVETTEHEVDGIAVCRARFAVPDATRPLGETYHHPLLAEVIERELGRARPDLLYQVSGYLFGTLPLEVAARRGIPSALFVMDYWHVCQRITLLRPDGSCCPGPRHPADCAACRLAARSTLQRLGPLVNRAWWRLFVAAGRTPLGATRGDALGVADFASRHDAIRDALATAGLVIANSAFLARQMERAGIPPERLLVARQGVERGEFERQPRPPATAGEELRVLYLGQFGHHKGVDLAVDAVGRLRAAGLAVQLRLHGPLLEQDDYVARLKQRVATLDEPIRRGIQLRPALSRGLLTRALQDADILVVPSRWYENSPNVILEAFAAGVPVVVAGHGGMAEMVRDGVDGLHFQPGDARSLEDALRLLALDPALMARLRGSVRQPYGIDEEMALETAALDQLLGAAAPSRQLAGTG